jgi:uncharacterized protein YndB with AHSA1/START domain
LENERIVGLTKSHGFQISVTKTLTVSHDLTWDFILSEEGIHVWLGQINIEDFELKNPFVTQNGTACELRSFKPGLYIKLNWKPETWSNLSKVEIRIDKRKGGVARFGVLHSHLTSLGQRAEMKKHWDSVILKLETALKDLDI